MDTRNYSSSAEGQNSDKRRHRTIFYIVIFVVGVIAGVIGLCSALKFIFYVGLIVTIVAAVAIIIGVVLAKNKVESKLEERNNRQIEE